MYDDEGRGEREGEGGGEARRAGEEPSGDGALEKLSPNTLLDSLTYKRPPNEGGTNSKNQRRKPDRERAREIEHKGMEVRIRRKGFLGFLERGEEGMGRRGT